MPITRSLNKALNTAVIHYSGIITFEDMKRHIEKFRTLQDVDNDTKIILIMSPDTDLSRLTNGDMHRIASIAPMTRNKVPHVIVAPEALSFGLSRMFSAQRLSEPSEISVVRTVAEACSLLNISDFGAIEANLTQVIERDG